MSQHIALCFHPIHVFMNGGIDLIVKTTGLTIEEVQQLQSNQTENQTE